MLVSVLIGMVLLVAAVSCAVYGVHALRSASVEERNRQEIRARVIGDGEVPKPRLAWLQERLDAAGSTLDATAAVGLAMALVLVAVVLGMILSGVYLAVILGVSALALSWYSLIRRMRVRKSAFEEQLGQCLPMLAENIRSGSTFDAAARTVGNHMEDPLREQFKALSAERTMGVPIADAVSNMAKRTGSKDADMLSAVVAVQSETGGSMADMLDAIADTIQRRVKMRRRVSAVTADGRFSAIIIAAVPVVVFAVLSITVPDYMSPMFSNPMGLTMLLVAFVFIVTGLLLVRKLYRIDIY